MADMISLTRTCTQLSGLYQYLVPSQWNIDHLLNWFVKDTDGFRAQMAKYNALVSGSPVREFFERALQKQTDLLCNVETSDEVNQLGEYLCQREAYVWHITTPLDSRNGRMVSFPPLAPNFSS